MRHRLFSTLSLTIFLLTACATSEDYQQDVETWQAERIASLRQPESYLTIIGLHWLRPGETSFGSEAAAAIRLPDTVPPIIGRFEFDGTDVVMHVDEDHAVMVEGQRVSEPVVMLDDSTDSPVTASLGRFSWVIIERNGRHGVRIRDSEHSIINDFGPLPYYTIDPGYRVSARMKRYAEPKVVQVGTVIEGLGWEPESPGVVEFELDGQQYSLEAYASSNDRLFFVFGDRTNGKETYPAGRFLYADEPRDGELTVLDFNKSYSPPCAFNDFSTCPVATPANRLPVVIRAGEKYDEKLSPMGLN